MIEITGWVIANEALITILNALVAVALTLSVTFAVKEQVPAVVGVPVTTPAALKDKPAHDVP
jgi:hypothetical protein